MVVAVATAAAVCDDKDRGGSSGAARTDLLAPRAKSTWFRSKFIGGALLDPLVGTAASVRRRFEKSIGGGGGGGSEVVSTGRSRLTRGFVKSSGSGGVHLNCFSLLSSLGTIRTMT